MARVMLINPPWRIHKKLADFDVHFPIGLLNIAAMVKDICQVRIFDSLVNDFEIIEKGDYALYGATFAKIKANIRGFNPDIVGISVPFYTQAPNAVALSRLCKEVNPRITVVFGGADPSVRFEQYIKDESCDFCVSGEGEKAFREFVKGYPSLSVLRSIEGLAYKIDDKIEFKPRKPMDNLDEIPFPAYELINIKDYLNHPYLYRNRSRIHKNSITMITSRGCPLNCIFCSIKLHMGSEYRAHSAEYVIRHLRYCIDKLGITNFHFEDDNISLDNKRFIRILNGILENKLNIRWDLPNGVRIDSLDYDILKKMKQAGCRELFLAVESGNQGVLNNVIRKGTSLDYCLIIAQYCRKLRMKANAFYVIGFPKETIDNIRETFSFALRLLRHCDVIPIILYSVPLPGTELYDICLKEGYITKDFFKNNLYAENKIHGEPCFSTKDFTREEIINEVNRFRARLTRELILYFLRHPFFSLRRIVNKPRLMKRFLIFTKH